MVCLKREGVEMQSDEQIINNFVRWLRKTFKRLEFKTHVPLNELFPEPKQPILKKFWRNKWSHADIAVFRHGKLITVIEPGGHQHLTDELQVKRDRKKLAICISNKVTFLPIMNQAVRCREHPQFKRLLKYYFYQKRSNEL